MFVIKDSKDKKIEISLEVDDDGDVRVLANNIGVLYFCNEDLNVKRLHISPEEEDVFQGLGVKMTYAGRYRHIEMK
jgi:hypothetical protein